MNSSTSSFKRLAFVYVAACAGAFALLAGASEWLVRTQVFPQDTLRKHVALFEQTTSPYVAFGDSHVARGFDAQDPVVNLAYPSESVEKMAWKASRYLEKTPKVKTALIQADPHLFAAYRKGAGLGDYPIAFAGESGSTLLSLSARYRPQLIALWQVFVKSGGRMKSKIETTPQGALLSPGNLATWTEAQIQEFTAYRVNLHVPNMRVARSSDITLYREIVAKFVDAGADICLVSFPTAPVYRQYVENLSDAEKRQWNAARDFFAELARHPRIRFIDDTARFDDPTLFRDPDHLNKTGAVKYGPMLQNACFNDDRRDVIAASRLPAR
ncbi:MAG: hypothetical protein AAFX54_16315 [Pseudomonadota bacterium]